MEEVKLFLLKIYCNCICNKLELFHISGRKIIINGTKPMKHIRIRIHELFG